MGWHWLHAAEELLKMEVERTLRFLDEFERSQEPERSSIDSAAAETPYDSEFMECLAEDLYELANTKRIAHVAVLLKAFSIVEAVLKNAQEYVWKSVEDGLLDEKQSTSAAPAGSADERLPFLQPPEAIERHKVREAFKVVRRIGERKEAVMKKGSINPVLEELKQYTNKDDEALNLKSHASYSKVNDVRILNNAFKHGGGVFSFSGPDSLSKDQARILAIFGESDSPSGHRLFQIPYERLEVREYVTAAKDFASFTHNELHQFLSKSPVVFK